MKKELTKELYHRACDTIHAPDALLQKVQSIQNHETKPQKRIILRRTAIAAAAIIILLAVSNLVTLAATGNMWVSEILWHDEKPNQPMENVRAFFIENGDRFDGDPADARRNYYGGTYLDGGTQVILLTDLSGIDEYADFGDNVRFEQCRYTYAELTGTMNTINETLPPMIRRHNGAAEDMVSWGINDKDNCIIVSIYNMDDDKVKWFRNNVCDKDYLVFVNTDSRLMDLDALPAEE